MEHKVFVRGQFGARYSNLLHIAAVGGDPEIIQVLIDAGVDVSAAERYTSHTPLHIAIMNGHEAAALALIKANSDVSAVSDIHTPLHAAARRGNLVLVKALLLAGADGWARSVHLHTPIHCASQNNHDEVVAYLAEVLNVTEPHKRCWTTLHDSIYNGHSQCVHIMSLLEEGASVSAVDWSDHTPLHIAAIRGSDGKIVQLLLDNGADIDAKEIQGKTPLEVAKFWPTDNRSLLRKEGAR